MLSICFPVITFIAVDVEKKFTMILLVFVDKIAFLATWLYKLKFPFSMSRHADELHNLQSGMRFHCDKVACTFYLYFLIM